MISFFLSFLRLRPSRHVSELQRRRRKQKTKMERDREKNDASMSFIACVLCRARQLGNRNNAPQTILSLRRRCPILSLSFSVLRLDVYTMNFSLTSYFFFFVLLVSLDIICRRSDQIFSFAFAIFFLFSFFLYVRSLCTYHDLFNADDSRSSV